MSNVTFEKQSPVLANLTIDVPATELENKLKTELKNAQKTANLRGFRKGKAPIPTLKKMMGNEMLGKILDKEINDALFGYIEENKLDIIFSPMPAEDQDMVDIDARNVRDVSLKYELALRPEVKIDIPSTPFDRYQLKTDDAFVDERLEALRRQMAEAQEVEKDIQENDVLTVALTELEKGAPKEGGIVNEAKLFSDAIEPTVFKKLKGKDVGHTIEVNVNELEKDATETYVRRYLLEVEEGVEFSDTFQLEVKSITRRDLAELDEDFFKKFDPSGEVTDEAALRERIIKDNAEGFNQQGNSMVDYAVQKHLVENTEIELPEAFLHRVHEEGEQPYDRFERGIRWMLIRNAYLKESELEITQEDIREAAAGQLLRMMGGQRPEWLNDEFIDNYAARVLQDEKQRDELVYQVTESKIMEHLRGRVTLNDVELTSEEFNEKIQSFNAEFADEEE